ncbi:MAG: NTP transferase domain-containing protein [Terriglobales bacterium]|jgi:molybdenum cofactor cytidylyltransferase
MGRSPSFAGVILAAGDSTRMGQDKALLPWEGGTFLSAAIDLLKRVTELVIVVGGKNTNSVLPTIYQTGAFITENHHTDRGQFSSLQIGLQEVLNRGRDTAIVALVDRPAPHLKTVQAIKRHFLESLQNGAWAVVPEFEGKHGHPFVAGREMIERFLRAPQEATARDIEHAAQQHISYLKVNDPLVIANVDTPEQYQELGQNG